MNIQNYLEQKKEVYCRLIRFIEGDNDIEENFLNLGEIIKNQEILNDRQEFRTFLHLIAKISNNHHRIPNFFDKIKRILDYLKTDINKYYSNDEIYQIFKSNKRILLFMIESKIIFIDKSIISKMIESKYIKMKYPQFFSPEIKQFIDQNGQIEYDYDLSKIEYFNEDDGQAKELDLIKEINQELPEKFNEKRYKGENDDYLTEMIRNDMIEEFIIYVEKQSYPLTSLITPSIYETNYYLLKKNPTLIEYSAFFGSSQIFKYLYKNGVELQPTLWNYAIHSDDPQMIHLLEENHINYSFDDCFIESIKCHHNDVANYIELNFSEDQSKRHQNEKILSQIIRYYNFLYFPLNSQEIKIFLFACGYDYLTLCKSFLATSKIDINSTVTNSIQNKNLYKMEFYNFFLNKNALYYAAKNNNQEILNILLNQKGIEIKTSCFENCTKLTQISIPSYVKEIGDDAFNNCSSLIEIIIPSSVTSIGDRAFFECYSLANIELPSSITSIGKGAFLCCNSMKKIKISTSLTSIQKNVFDECSSLIEISIPSSVKSICEFAFNHCLSLQKILIPSSVISIRDFAFSDCKSLKKIEFETPSSIKTIHGRAFFNCESLEEFVFPSSLNVISSNLFAHCTSLTKVVISNSIEEIGEFAFYDCKSLKEINIPPSVKIIGLQAFNGCTSLTEFTIPNTVKVMHGGVFYKCFSLKQVKIPIEISQSNFGLTSNTLVIRT